MGVMERSFSLELPQALFPKKCDSSFRGIKMINRPMIGIIGSGVGFLANMVTVLGASGIIYAIAYPETVASILDRMSDKVDIISESVPLWPVLDNMSYVNSLPEMAGIHIDISNPKNILIQSFFGTYQFKIDGVDYSGVFDVPAIFPPNETVVIRENINRENWFPRLLKSDDILVSVCFEGVFEGRESVFQERREYSLEPRSQRLQLLSREFESNALADCN
jgi:hypothetical protein